MRSSSLRSSAKVALNLASRSSVAPFSGYGATHPGALSTKAACLCLGKDTGGHLSGSSTFSERSALLKKNDIESIQNFHSPFLVRWQAFAQPSGVPSYDILRALSDRTGASLGEARETTADTYINSERGPELVDEAALREEKWTQVNHGRRQQEEAGQLHIAAGSQAFLQRSRGAWHDLRVVDQLIRSRGGGYCSTPLELLRRPHGALQVDGMLLKKRDKKGMSTAAAKPQKAIDPDSHNQTAVTIALLCNALVLLMKLGVYFHTRSSVMLAEAVHSLADLGNQGLLAYGLLSSKRAPDKAHPYGYTKERFVWALISATGIFCLGSGLTVAHGIQCLYNPELQEVQNVYMAGGIIAMSAILEGASLYVAYKAVVAGAKSEKMSFVNYLWRGHDPTAVAVLMEDGAAVTGLGIAAASTAAVHFTGNQIYDAIGSIAVGGLLGVVAVILISRNREALLGRSMDEDDVRKVLYFLRQDPVVDAVWDCKSEVIGPGAYRFKAEIDFNGVTVVQHHLNRVGRGALYQEVREAVAAGDDAALEKVMGNYGEELMTALGSEVDRLEREIQRLVPEILHLDIEAHNPLGPTPKERLYVTPSEE